MVDKTFCKFMDGSFGKSTGGREGKSVFRFITTAKTQKQPKCPLTGEWITLWYIYTMEYYSAIKRNAFESVLMMLMNLEPIIQSEVS